MKRALEILAAIVAAGAVIAILAMSGGDKRQADCEANGGTYFHDEGACSKRTVLP